MESFVFVLCLTGLYAVTGAAVFLIKRNWTPRVAALITASACSIPFAIREIIRGIVDMGSAIGVFASFIVLSTIIGIGWISAWIGIWLARRYRDAFYGR